MVRPTNPPTAKPTQPTAYVIEIDDQCAGLALCEDGQVRFVACHRCVRSFDGQCFRTVLACQRQVGAALRQSTAKPVNLT